MEMKVGLQELGTAGTIALDLLPVARGGAPSADVKPYTAVTLFDQGIVQILQASVSGLEPRKPYVLALSDSVNGAGRNVPLAAS